MGMKDSAPNPPDYQGLAETQAESSRGVTEQQTVANRPQQNTPWGSVSWDKNPQWDPATEQWLNEWTQNVELSPDQQEALDAQMSIQSGRSGLAESLLGRSEDEFGQPVDWSGFEDIGGVPDLPQYGTEGFTEWGEGLDRDSLQGVDPSQRYYDEAGDASYGQFEQRMEPRFETQSSSLDTKLRNQGLRPGDEAYDLATSNLYEDQEDARRQAQREATLLSGQEAERMYGMDLGLRGQEVNEMLAGSGFSDSQRGRMTAEMLRTGGQGFQEAVQGSQYQTQIRQEQIAEDLQRRGFSLNEINAILSGQQVGLPAFPGFNTAARPEGTQNLAAGNMQFGADMGEFGANQAMWNNLMGGASSMATLGF